MEICLERPDQVTIFSLCVKCASIVHQLTRCNDLISKKDPYNINSSCYVIFNLSKTVIDLISTIKRIYLFNFGTNFKIQTDVISGGVSLLAVVWIFGVVSLIFNVYLIITMTKSALDVLQKVPHRFIYRILVTTIAIGSLDFC